MDDGADDSDSGGWSQQSNSEQTDKQQVFIMENEDSDRFTLEEEKEKRQEVDLLYEKNRVQLRKKEEHSIKEVEMNPYLETTIRTRDIVSEIVRVSEVSESSDKEKSLLRENRLFWDEIAKLRVEIDTVKNQTQEMGKEYFENIAIIKEKNDRLQKTIRETVSQHNVQLEVLRAELIMLNSKLENEQQNRGRLEVEVESYQSRLAIAVQDHEHCQTSKRDLQHAFQRARDEWFCLRDRMNFDMSNLKHNNEILSQQFSKMESKTNNLETELHHTRDALKERTLVLERDLSQKQCQQEETEHMYQEEQGKVDEDVGKQEYLQEKLSHLQRENKLLRQQLDQAHNKADREENRAINIQDQIQDKISIFNAESVKQIIMLDERINELINEWHHFNERIHQYDNDNVERDAIVRQLQEELVVVRPLQQKISMIEASQEVESCHPVLLQDKTHDLKKDLDQSRSQSQHKKEESKKNIDLKVFLQQRLQQVLNKTDDLEEEVTRLKELLEDIKEKLNECDNEELSFPGDLKPSPANMEIQSKKPKQKPLRESQEMSEQMINIQASLRRPLELRNKELESELSRLQASRDNSKRELEKYMQLYQEQLEKRKLLENQLTETKERLAEVSTELLLEKQQNRLLCSAPKMRPVLGAPCAGNHSNSFVPRRNSTPRENLDSPTARSYTLTYHKVWQEYEEILTREVKKDAAKFEAES